MFDGLLRPQTLVLIAIAALIAAYLYYLEKKPKKTSASALCKTYAVLTEETLAALPDGELTRAVVANIMAKHDKKHPDPLSLLPTLTGGQGAVYTVWLLCHELEKRGFDTFFRSPSKRFAEPAADGLASIGATNTAAALRAAMRAADEETAPLWEAVTTVFHEAETAEQPLALCVRYIREHTDEFID